MNGSDFWKGLGVIVGGTMLFIMLIGGVISCANRATYGPYVGKPHLVCETEDGVKLYRWTDGARWIYFSSRGTEYKQTEGKTTHTVQVPNQN